MRMGQWDAPDRLRGTAAHWLGFFALVPVGLGRSLRHERRVRGPRAGLPARAGDGAARAFVSPRVSRDRRQRPAALGLGCHLLRRTLCGRGLAVGFVRHVVAHGPGHDGADRGALVANLWRTRRRQSAAHRTGRLLGPARRLLPGLDRLRGPGRAVACGGGSVGRPDGPAACCAPIGWRRRCWRSPGSTSSARSRPPAWRAAARP